MHELIVVTSLDWLLTYFKCYISFDSIVTIIIVITSVINVEKLAWGRTYRIIRLSIKYLGP